VVDQQHKKRRAGIENRVDKAYGLTILSLIYVQTRFNHTAVNYIITTSMDMTSNEIISWLRYYDVPCTRINTDSSDTLYALADIQMGTGMRTDIGVVYLRKLAMPENIMPASDTGRAIWQSLMGEYYQAYLKPLISQAALSVNNYSSATQLNKYETLLAARSLGLAIPETVITNSKKALHTFLCNNGYTAVVTKPADELCSFSTETHQYKTFTKKLGPEEISALPDQFFPSLFQQAVSNLLDIKAVYCFGQFYAVAYLQTDHIQTDFRSNYAHVKTLPYQLPDDIKHRLDALLKQLSLSVCTVDFILSHDRRLYFLEVNPFGQFGAISSAGNYYIEKQIAQKFIPYAS